MTDSVLLQIVADYKSAHSTKIGDCCDLLLAERNIHEYAMTLALGILKNVFLEVGQGYEGPRIEREGRTLKFHSFRTTTLQGLFGLVDYRRAYYVPTDGESGGCFPLDERLGIEARHTPGCQYFLSSFTGREAYGRSLQRFHEIFRPSGTDLISLRKALDMGAEMAGRLERLRRQEISTVFEHKKDIATEATIQGVMAVSVDATKVREKGEQRLTVEGKTTYEIEWRDAKVGSVSQVGWNERRQEAFCSATSYVGGIEHADEFFKRLYVEMKRRSANLPTQQTVFLADGGNWIWDRLEQVAPEAGTVFILDFFHACEHVSDLCKRLYGQLTPDYWVQFKRLKSYLYHGKLEMFFAELTTLRDRQEPGSELRTSLQTQLEYFSEHKERMHYDRYRAKHLPIGSGTIESACKNVIGGRMKQGGMTWSSAGADGMVQLRCSLENGRFLNDFIASVDNVA